MLNSGEVFVASNGLAVNTMTPEAGLYVDGRPFYINADQMIAFGEFFQAKRDAEMGRWRWRWRWPENPYYVVYGFKNSVRVLCETDGTITNISRGRAGGALESTRMDILAARAYFEAHPVPKPWHDAKPGEFWEVTLSVKSMGNIPSGVPLPMQVMLDDSGEMETLFFVHWNGPDHETIDAQDLHIEKASRIWPEEKK